jgi:Tfp pilus assembly protein PilN
VPPTQLANITPAALGLGLWNLDEHIPTLDVLNRSTSKADPLAELRERLPVPAFDRSLAIAGGLAVVTFLVGLGGTYYVATNVIGKKIAELKSTNATLSGRIATSTAEKEQLTKQEAAKRQILELIGEGARPNPSVTFLTQVDEIMPSDAWLMGITASTPEVFELKGAPKTQQAGLTLAQKISEFREVDQVKVMDLAQTEPGRYEFTITATFTKSAFPGGQTASAAAPATDRPASGAAATPPPGEAAMNRFNTINPEGQKK